MEPASSKAAVKAAKADAIKAAKKKPDPDGLTLIEEAVQAFTNKNLDKALALFKLATEKCKESAVAIIPKEKKAAPTLSAADGAAEAVNCLGEVREAEGNEIPAALADMLLVPPHV